MANPLMGDGWFKMPHGLDAALAVGDFTKSERIVLREVIAQHCGPKRCSLVELSPTQIARLVGTNRGNIGHAIASLTDGGTLVRVDKAYRLETDFRAWTRRGQRRLTEIEVAYCSGAVARVMANRVVQPDNGPVVQPDNGPVVQPDNGLLSNETTALYRKNLRTEELNQHHQAPSEDGGQVVGEEGSGLPIPTAPETNLTEMVALIRDAVLRTRAKGGHLNDEGSAENACRHAKLLAPGSYAPADVASAYLSAIETNPSKPGKWGQAVSTILANGKVRRETTQSQIRSAPVPQGFAPPSVTTSRVDLAKQLADRERFQADRARFQALRGKESPR